MGTRFSRTERSLDHEESQPAGAFKYPPKTGPFFANHFMMGGERFDSPQPEAFLFGENSDLNFLTRKAVPFPYTAPGANDLSKPLKSVINIRRESLRLVRIFNENGTGTSSYNIEFLFDANVDCVIKILYFAKEEFVNHGLSYVSRDPSINSEKFSYSKGANQLFNQPSHSFSPSDFDEEELTSYNEDREVAPVVIYCVTADDEEIIQTHVTLAIVERAPDSSFVLKALKQKQCIDGLCYLLQEVYGIENKNASCTEYESGEEDCEESGGDCVVCMSDPRDTLILPCRHLCLCNSCAESLRYQANNCPICRVPFRALLQIRALQKREIGDGHRPTDDEDNVPNGYEAVSLIEALNGPSNPGRPVPKPENDTPPATPAAVARVPPEPRPRKKSKKVTIGKVTTAEELPVTSVEESVVPRSPALSVKSGLSNSVPELYASAGISSSFHSLPHGMDQIEIVSEVPIKPSTVRRAEDEEEAKDSDQTNDSTSSSRSFNALIRHNSQESVEIDIDSGPRASTTAD